MGTKTISIMDDAYEILKRKKHPHESFSEGIRRLLGKEKRSLKECIGLWSDIPDKDFDEMERTIKEMREYTTKSVLRKVR